MRPSLLRRDGHAHLPRQEPGVLQQLQEAAGQAQHCQQHPQRGQEPVPGGLPDDLLHRPAGDDGPVSQRGDLPAHGGLLHHCKKADQEALQGI